MTTKWISDLQAHATAEKAKVLSRFFKTGKGEYGEGDIFIGVTVPDNRCVARLHTNESLETISQMLKSKIHEHRLSALLTLVEIYTKEKSRREEIFNFYINNLHGINNWDLVDLSAPKIVGHYLLTIPSPTLLQKLSNSTSQWQRRIAIVATLELIRNGIFDPTLDLAEKYLSDPEPLIHKATGWMLREIGKKDETTLIKFLDSHSKSMPRTALRYSIERLTPEQKRYYMEK